MRADRTLLGRGGERMVGPKIALQIV